MFAHMFVGVLDTQHRRLFRYVIPNYLLKRTRLWPLNLFVIAVIRYNCDVLSTKVMGLEIITLFPRYNRVSLYIL